MRSEVLGSNPGLSWTQADCDVMSKPGSAPGLAVPLGFVLFELCVKLCDVREKDQDANRRDKR